MGGTSADDTPAPLQVLPAIDYRTAGSLSESKAPAALTIVAIVSLCIGAFGLIANVALLGYTLKLLGTNTPPRAVAPASAPANIAPYTGTFITPHGLDRAQRKIALAAADEKLSLPLDRWIMLERLLSEHGKRIFPTAPLTAQSAAEAITEAGQLPAGRDGLRSFGTHYFKTRGGAVLLDDSLARFHPAAPDGISNNYVRVNHETCADDIVAPHACASDVERVIDQLRTKLGDNLNPHQATTLGQSLRTTLMKDSRSPRRPDDERNTPLPNIQVLPGGILNIQSGAGTFIQPDGRAVSQYIPVRLVSYMSPRSRYPSLTPTLLSIASADAIISAVLAVLLITCGVGLLRDSPWAGRRHAQWAWLKLFTTALAVVPIVLIAVAVAQDLDRNSRSGAYMVLAPAAAISVLVIRCAHPLAALLVLRRAPVREHILYHGGTTTAMSDSTRRAGIRVTRALTVGWRGRIIRLALLGLLLASGIAYFVMNPPPESASWWTTTTARTTLAALGTIALVSWFITLGPRRVAASVLILVTLAPFTMAARPQGPGQMTRAYEQTKQQLIDADRDESKRAETYAALRKKAEAGDISLFQLLTDPEERIRVLAAHTLAAEEPVPSPGNSHMWILMAKDDLTEQLKSAHRLQRVAAERLLKRIPEGQRLVDGVAAQRVLQHVPASAPTTRQYDTVRNKLAAVPQDRQARSTEGLELVREAERGDLSLYALLSDRDPDVRRRAALLLTSDQVAHPGAAKSLIHKALPHLHELVRSDSIPARLAGVRLIAVLGDTGARELIPYLDDPQLRQLAALVIGVQINDQLSTKTKTLLEAKIPILLDMMAANPKLSDSPAHLTLRKLGMSQALYDQLKRRFDTTFFCETFLVPLLRQFPQSDERDDLFCAMAASANPTQITYLAGQSGSITQGYKPDRLHRVMQSTDARVRRGAMKFAMHWLQTRGDDKTVDLILASPEAPSDQSILGIAGMAIARRTRDAFEDLTRQAVVNGSADATLRLTAASKAAVSRDLQALLDPQARDTSLQNAASSALSRDGWVACAEIFWDRIHDGDTETRKTFANLLSSNIHVPDPGPKWFPVLRAAKSGSDPKMASLAFENEFNQQRSTAPTWPQPTPAPPLNLHTAATYTLLTTILATLFLALATLTFRPQTGQNRA